MFSATEPFAIQLAIAPGDAESPGYGTGAPQVAAAAGEGVMPRVAVAAASATNMAVAILARRMRAI
jgi:hypothetical protein